MYLVLVWMGRAGGGGDKRTSEGRASSPFFQGRSLNLQAFEPVQDCFVNHQRRGRGHLRLLSGPIQGQHSKQ